MAYIIHRQVNIYYNTSLYLFPPPPRLPELQKVLQGVGHLRGAVAELSPGIPPMCRYVEMRLACTATRLPPTPADKERAVSRGLTHREEKELLSTASRSGTARCWNNAGQSIFDPKSTFAGCKELKQSTLFYGFPLVKQMQFYYCLEEISETNKKKTSQPPKQTQEV